MVGKLRSYTAGKGKSGNFYEWDLSHSLLLRKITWMHLDLGYYFEALSNTSGINPCRSRKCQCVAGAWSMGKKDSSKFSTVPSAFSKTKQQQQRSPTGWPPQRRERRRRSCSVRRRSSLCPSSPLPGTNRPSSSTTFLNADLCCRVCTSVIIVCQKRNTFCTSLWAKFWFLSADSVRDESVSCAGTCSVVRLCGVRTGCFTKDAGMILIAGENQNSQCLCVWHLRVQRNWESWHNVELEQLYWAATACVYKAHYKIVLHSSASRPLCLDSMHQLKICSNFVAWTRTLQFEAKARNLLQTRIHGRRKKQISNKTENTSNEKHFPLPLMDACMWCFETYAWNLGDITRFWCVYRQISCTMQHRPGRPCLSTLGSSPGLASKHFSPLSLASPTQQSSWCLKVEQRVLSCSSDHGRELIFTVPRRRRLPWNWLLSCRDRACSENNHLP